MVCCSNFIVVVVVVVVAVVIAIVDVLLFLPLLHLFLGFEDGLLEKRFGFAALVVPPTSAGTHRHLLSRVSSIPRVYDSDCILSHSGRRPVKTHENNVFVFYFIFS